MKGWAEIGFVLREMPVIDPTNGNTLRGERCGCRATAVPNYIPAMPKIF
jgi:hypothetical protein